MSMDWESRYRENDTPWDLGQPAPALVDLSQKKPALFRHVRSALVPGCGSGHDTLFLARTLPDAKITGLDLSDSALAKAREADHHDLVTWQQGDFLKKIEVPDPRYDLIWEHTCFCAIPISERTRYATNAHHLLKPNGFILGVFYLELGIPPEDGPPFGTEMAELKNILGGNFMLEWHDPNPPTDPKRQGREILALWRRLASCADGTGAVERPLFSQK